MKPKPFSSLKLFTWPWARGQPLEHDQTGSGRGWGLGLGTINEQFESWFQQAFQGPSLKKHKWKPTPMAFSPLARKRPPFGFPKGTFFLLRPRLQGLTLKGAAGHQPPAARRDGHTGHTGCGDGPARHPAWPGPAGSLPRGSLPRGSLPRGPPGDPICRATKHLDGNA